MSDLGRRCVPIVCRVKHLGDNVRIQAIYTYLKVNISNK